MANAPSVTTPHSLASAAAHPDRTATNARTPLLATLAVVAVAVLGCGAAGDADTAVGGALAIAASEFAFEPASATIAADSDVEITLENLGVVPHVWAIQELGVDIHVDAGQTVTESVHLPAGTYEIVCTVPGHAEAGMVGTLVVE